MFNIQKNVLIFLLLCCSQVLADAGQAVSAHGCLMIITWVLFASTSLLIQRYFKHLPFHIPLHIFFGVFIPTVSLGAFFTILFGFAKGTWVSPGMPYTFAHSIFGILAIGLSFFQVITGLFRVSFDEAYLLRYLHRFAGVIAFIFATVAIFLANFFLFLINSNPTWIIVLVWIIWLCSVIFILELIYYFNQNNTVAMNIVLVIHVIFALTITLLECIYIGIYADKVNNTGYSDLNQFGR